MSFPVVDSTGQLTWHEQDAVDNLMAHEDALAVDVRGRDKEGNLAVAVRVWTGGSTETRTEHVLISDEADGAKYSKDGDVFVPAVDRLRIF